MEFEYEFGPALVALAFLAAALGCAWWFRRGRFHRMTPREREWTLRDEKRDRDRAAGRD